MNAHQATIHPAARRAGVPLLGVWLALSAMLVGAPAGAVVAAETYSNPLVPPLPGGAVVESCADPNVMYGAEGEGRWFMYCTTDPFNGEDRDASGNLIFHLIPMFSSTDLVSWTYEGDAFTTRPAWLAPNSGMWAPEIAYVNGQYHLYFTVARYQSRDYRRRECHRRGDRRRLRSARGRIAATPLSIPPRRSCCPNDKRWTFDPDVVEFGGTRYIYYGSYFGGISVRALTPDGLESLPATQVDVAIANRYEGAEVVVRDGFLLPVRVGHQLLPGRPDRLQRLRRPLERPVRPVRGPRGRLPDVRSRRWHAGHQHERQPLGRHRAQHRLHRLRRPVVDDLPRRRPRTTPTSRAPSGSPSGRRCSTRSTGSTAGPPSAAGTGRRTTAMPAPAAQPGDITTYAPSLAAPDMPGDKLGWASDEFNSRRLHPRWEWVRPETADTSFIAGGLQFPTQPADLFGGSNNASVLVTDAPDGDYIVETRVRLDLPAEGCCFNYVQAGLVVYEGDDAYVKLVHVASGRRGRPSSRRNATTRRRASRSMATRSSDRRRNGPGCASRSGPSMERMNTVPTPAATA